MKRLVCVIVFAVCCICGSAFADITVGKNKDYTSFTQAAYETVDSGETIVVYPGVYDIKAEYEALFGDKVPELFSKGIFIHDRKIIFLPGSQLTCIWDRNDNFSALYSGGNVILDGMNLYAEGCLYAVHDDLWHWEEPYINEYRHCRIIGRYLKNNNCIGGGVALNARIIIDDCYFDNGVDNTLTVRYHNIDLNNAKGDIWISNSYFNGYLALCYYGNSAHLDVYVNGCTAECIETRPEIPGEPILNIDLYKWNNEIDK